MAGNENQTEDATNDFVDSDLNDDSAPNWALHEQAVIALRAHEGQGFDSLLRGGRDMSEVDWDFHPLVLPSYVHVGEHPTDASVESRFYTVTNRSGNPTSFQIFNPDIRTKQQPIGAVLGEVSERYAAVSFPVTYAPFAEMCASKGWDWKITCYDQGKVARMDITVATAEELGTDRKKRKVGDVYKYGLTIHNSLDGSSGLRITAYCERLVCSNGMVCMQKRNLASYRHTAGGIGSIDFEKFAIEVGEMAADVKREIMLVERMKGIKMTDDLFDRLQVEAARRGIITLPKAKPVLDPITGETVDWEIQRGHGWRINKEGWENPSRDWVKVEGEDVGTAFQAYQVIAGGLTHKPPWHGPATWNGEGHSNINGRSLNLRTLEQRLHATHLLMCDVLEGRLDLEKKPTTEQAIGIMVAN